MRIEIAEAGRMTQTGSSLRKLIQNNDMPILDLLVRESIQNSLDARKSDAKYVDINYLTGKFKSKRLSKELEGITDALDARFTEAEYEYIAVRDSNTVGLTGVMDYKKVKDNDYGNLLKLIYEICKPQDAEGAGGSWGIGKTVYFRIGIGMVIYYSRIIDENGKFASRLAASYVEDENSKDAMIPVYSDEPKRGIAWWGDYLRENTTQPVTNENEIKRFLDIFKLNAYEGNETGTTIIIPYIDREQLLLSNKVEYSDNQNCVVAPYWYSSVEEYIKIAVQRWYAPRLNNPYYNDAAYLRLKINNEGLSKDAMAPIFKVIQALYNRAHHVKEDDILASVEDVTKSEKLTVNTYLTDKTVGTVAYTKVSRELLEMNAPYNRPEPYMYFNCEIRDKDVNMPTICFTRMPAMIVSYENIGPWTSSIAPTSKEEYIIGIFVLNSLNRMKNSPLDISLEEYIRRSEMADHTSWSDWSQGVYNPRIVCKVQDKVNKLISKDFAPEDKGPRAKENSGLGKMFGDLLLPPDGFGKKPNPGQSPDSVTQKKVPFRFNVDINGVKYTKNQMIVPLILEASSKNKISNAGFDILIDSESGKIEMETWERIGFDMPFYISSCSIDIIKIDGKEVNGKGYLDRNDRVFVEDYEMKKRTTNSGNWNGVNISSSEAHSLKAKLELTITINRRDVKPYFSFEKGVKNNG